MKKLAVLFAALLAVAFTAPAFAADNLELSGQFRVRGWDINNRAYTDNNDHSYFDQRMRVQAKIKASDNAYVVIRTDVAEGTWGSNFAEAGGPGNGSWYRPNQGTSTLQIDRAYGYYGQDNWGVTMGLQYYGLGILEVVDGQYTGMKLDLKFDGINPTFIYGKLEENGTPFTAGNTRDDGNNDDADLFALNLNFGFGGFDTNIFGAYVAGDYYNIGPVIDDAWAVGFYTAGKLGMFNLVAELAFLEADPKNLNNVDIDGTQFYLKADTDLNEAINLGGEILWAAGRDDANDVQITNLNSDAGDFTIADTNAPCATDVVVVRGGSPFDPTGEGAGVVGASLFGSYKVMEKLTVGAKVAYLTPEEDDATDVDSLASYSLWAGYDLGSNTSVVLLYNIADMNSDDNTEDEAMNTLYARFMITF